MYQESRKHPEVVDFGMTIYLIFQYILMFWAAIFIGYPFILGILALFPQRKRSVQTAFNHSFLIVIHSRSKEQEISKTLYSLAGLVYPWNLYDMLVIADNCTDNMATVSKKLGAGIIECTPSDRNDLVNILHRAFEQVEHLDDKYDAIVFVGPNDLISGNFLEVINQYLEEGSVIIQSANRRISDLTTWKVKYQRVCWLLRTFIEALGRKKIGLGTMLLGGGMCFKTKILESTLIRLSHVQKDLEYSILSQAKELRIDFAPEAVIWSPLPDSSADAKLGQSHWSVRPFQVIKEHLKYFTVHFSGGKLLQRFDLSIGMITLPLILMFAVVVGNCIINIVLWRLGYIAARFWVIWMILTAMVIIYLSIGIAADRDGSPELSSDGKDM